jgi:hypothetical protein
LRRGSIRPERKRRDHGWEENQQGPAHQRHSREGLLARRDEAYAHAVDHLIDKLTKKQIEMLKDERMLRVEEVDVPADDEAGGCGASVIFGGMEQPGSSAGS